jgi:putative FmdB family regulatory protein
MPLYEYQCKTCESKFEILQRINEGNEELECPECGAPKPKKVFSSFAAVGNGAEFCATGST